MIVSHIEGGDCSQILFVARAYYLSKLGYNVKFETHWYKTFNEQQTNKNYIRELSFHKLFPSYPFQIATDEEIIEAKKNIKRCNDIHENDYKNQYIYINDQENRGITGFNITYVNVFIKNVLRLYMNPILNTQSNSILQTIINDKHSVAFHVRRGDVSSLFYQGNPVTKDYILKIIYFLYSKNKNITIYFFSDDPTWIKQNITLPCKYIIVENTVENGYIDLFLMTKCRIICSTQGYRSYFAYLLSYYSYIIPYRENETRSFDNILIYPALTTI